MDELFVALLDTPAGQALIVGFFTVIFLLAMIIGMLVRVITQRSKTESELAKAIGEFTQVMSRFADNDAKQTEAIVEAGSEAKAQHLKVRYWFSKLGARIDHHASEAQTAANMWTTQAKQAHKIIKTLNKNLETNTGAVQALNDRLDVFQQMQADLDALVKRLCPDDDEPKTETPAPTGQPPRAKQEPIVLRPEPNEEKDAAA